MRSGDEMMLVLVLVMLVVGGKLGWAAVADKEAEWVILGEAADQGFTGMLAVAEVLRRRGTSVGFSAAKRKGLRRFALTQPLGVQAQAREVWQMSKYTNISNGATHFENTQAFGVPVWAEGMKVTTRIGRLTFYRKAE